MPDTKEGIDKTELELVKRWEKVRQLRAVGMEEDLTEIFKNIINNIPITKKITYYSGPTGKIRCPECIDNDYNLPVNLLISSVAIMKGAAQNIKAFTANMSVKCDICDWAASSVGIVFILDDNNYSSIKTNALGFNLVDELKNKNLDYHILYS